MRYLILMLAMAFNSVTCLAQFVDKFTDGEFFTNPKWKGDTTNFIVNSALELQQNSPSVSDTSILYTNSAAVSNAEWRFDFTLDFNPSSSNFSRVFLMATSIKQSGFRHGYYIKIGGSEDEISLYYQNKKVHELIIDGVDKRINSNPASGQVQVFRDSTGKWELYVDLGSGSIKEGEAVHDSLGFSLYFGIFNKYSSTRSNKFYFDNFEVTGLPFIDTLPPEIKGHQLTSENVIEVQFNEPLQHTSYSNLQNFKLASNHQQPSESFVDTAYSKITLKFPEAFAANQLVGLIVDSIIDTAGNYMDLDTIWFVNTVYHHAQFGEVLLNEIMFDPSPSINLPEVEYLELYNHTTNNFNLSGWRLSDLKDTAYFPEFVLTPKEYVIIGNPNDSSILSSYGRFIGVGSFPTLNNSFDQLTLFDSSWQVIDSLTYQKSWITEEEKQNGGWSLERNSIANFCSPSSYWNASIDKNGGTPGKPNSIFGDSIRRTFPVIKSIHYEIGNSIIVWLGNRIDTSFISDNLKILIDGDSIRFTYAIKEDSILEISPLRQLSTGIHSITFYGLRNCIGEELPYINLDLALPQNPLSPNLIINEILFNPIGSGEDFVELFNSGDTIIDLYYYQLAEMESDTVVELYSITHRHEILFPGEFKVISGDSIDIKARFPLCPQGVHIKSKIPTMNNESGNVGLFAQGVLKEEIEYSENMHFELLTNLDGVTLERIDPYTSSSRVDNWHSASENSGYGTPGLPNSHLNHGKATSEMFQVEPDVISPDNNGVDDYLTITYNVEQPGFRANIHVFDRLGKEVFEICNSYQLGIKGKINWHGMNTNGQRPYIGIYFLLIEVYHENGKHIVERKPFVIAE